MSRFFIISALVVTPLASAAAAPGLTLPAGKINVAVNAEVGMSADSAGKPVSLSPDVAYGIDDATTVALVHSRFAATGFRAAVGGGLCLTGSDGGCPNVYDNVGLEGWRSLVTGELSVAAGGGVHALSIDGGIYAAKVGLKARLTRGALAFHALPSVFVAVTERGENATGGRLNPDRLWFPVQVTYKAAPPVTVGLGSGVKGPFSGFGDGWQIPVGVMGLYTVDPAMSVGGSFVFGQIVGGNDATGVDYRGLQLWLSYTR